jgi:hypothetical protein
MSVPRRSLLLFPLVAVLVGIGTGRVPDAALARDSEPFEVAELFLELNHTDGDLGIHGEIDQDAWTTLEIEGPGERMLLSLLAKGKLYTQGLTQFGFESAEPAFDELSPAAFLRRFPEGAYEIEARAQGGGSFESVVRLSHILAAPPDETVNGQNGAKNCDVRPLPEVTPPVLVNWAPVTRSHPKIGRSGSVRIERYQFFLEKGDTVLSVDLPPTVTEFEIPASLTKGPGVYKYEIIARTTANNNTAIESCFRIR